MREHWGLICKKIRRLAAPTAACLLLSPFVSAQDDIVPSSDEEGRIRIVDQSTFDQRYAAPISTVGAPVSQAADNSLQAIFSTGLQPQQCAPFAIHQKPQSLDTPNMIGDFLGYAGSVNFSTTTLGSLETSNGIFDLPGSGRVPKVAENNSAIPRDRFYFTYNHFHNAYSANTTVDPNALDMDMMPIDPAVESRTFHQNRFTLGIEKTLFYGDMSVEVRLPLVTEVDNVIPGFTDPTSTALEYATDDPTGNWSLILKKVLYDWYGSRTSGVFSSGVAFTFPTAEGVTVNLGDATFHVDDAGLHVSPFTTMLIESKQGWFIQGFIEFDYSTDKISIVDRAAGGVGKVDIPDVANFDFGAGWWLARYPDRHWWKGLAAIVEYHYTRQRQDFKSVAFQSNGVLSSSNVIVGAFDTRRDISNLTTGVHVLINDHVNARVAGVLPLKSSPDRQFDAEVVFQLDILR